MQQVDDVHSLGKQGHPAASPTSVLEEDPLVIGGWSMWESSSPIDPPNASQYASTIRTSPLRPSMSSPLPDAKDLTPTVGPERNINSHSTGSGRSLVETLQNCLTSLPQSTNVSDRGGTLFGEATTPPRQLSSRPPGKRRPRASRRAPTTILETNPSEFKDMVQKLTGIPSGNPGGAPVRPHPQRASPNHFVRPETLRSIRRLPPISSPQARAPMITPSPITFLEHLQRNNTSPVHTVMAPSALKREFLDESSSPPLYGGSHESAMQRGMSAPTTSMGSWWSDNDNSRGPLNSEPGSFTLSSGDPLTNAILSAASGTTHASPDFGGLDSADGQLAQEEQEFSFSQIEIESWLSAQDHASAESMRGGDA